MFDKRCLSLGVINYRLLNRKLKSKRFFTIIEAHSRVATLAWISIGVVWGLSSLLFEKNFGTNELGDFFAGWFAPLAFAFFVATVILQNRALKKQSEDLELNRQAINAQVDEMRHMVGQGQRRWIVERVEKFENDYFIKRYKDFENEARDFRGLLAGLCRVDHNCAVMPLNLKGQEILLEDLSVRLESNQTEAPFAVFFAMDECDDFRDIILKIKFESDPVQGKHSYRLMDQISTSEQVSNFGTYHSFGLFFSRVCRLVGRLKEAANDEVVEQELDCTNFGSLFQLLSSSAKLDGVIGETSEN